MEPNFFQKQSGFRNWLEKNHEKETELLVGFYRVGSGKPSMTWSQSVDEALCFGWIDGIRRSIDEESYTIRFTPRRKNSIWSKINIGKVVDLKKAGLMQPKGLDVFENRDPAKTSIYSFENESAEFLKMYEKKFKSNKKASTFFLSQAPSYQKTARHWVMSAKQSSTQLIRLQKLIEVSEAGKRI